MLAPTPQPGSPLGGRRDGAGPSHLIPASQLSKWPTDAAAPVFANEVGAPLRRTLFRSRIWRPALVRAGMLGAVTAARGGFEAQWTDDAGAKHVEQLGTEAGAVRHVSRHQTGGMRFHDLRHSYATWLVDDGVPVNMVQRVMGHERSLTTLDLYTRRTDNGDRILRALTDADDDPDEGEAGVLAPA
jgi:integrase